VAGNVSTLNPSGKATSTRVVRAFSFSACTSRVNCCRVFAFATGGLIDECAAAADASTSASAEQTSMTTSRRLVFREVIVSALLILIHE